MWLARWQRVSATVFSFKMLSKVGNKSCRGQGLEFLERIEHSREPVCACPGTEGSFALTRVEQAFVLFCALHLTTLIFVPISVAVTFQSLKWHYLICSESPQISEPLIIRGFTSQWGHPNSTGSLRNKSLFLSLSHPRDFFFFIRDKNLTK